MRIAFIDTECNSLDTKLGFIMELGWAVFEANSKRLLYSKSKLLRWNREYKVDPGAFEATGLTWEFCEKHGENAINVMGEFVQDMRMVDAICGHNLIHYDKNIIISNIKRALFDQSSDFEKKYDFDTMYDLPFEKKFKSMALKYLALDHGYILSDAHQALADVFACAAIFFKYDVRKIIEIANTPLVKISGFTDFHDQEGREKFYGQGFRWNRDAKRWEKVCREYHVPGTQLSLESYRVFSEGMTTTFEDKKEEPFNGLQIKPQDEIPF